MLIIYLCGLKKASKRGLIQHDITSVEDSSLSHML